MLMRSIQTCVVLFTLQHFLFDTCIYFDIFNNILSSQSNFTKRRVKDAPFSSTFACQSFQSVYILAITFVFSEVYYPKFAQVPNSRLLICLTIWKLACIFLQLAHIYSLLGYQKVVTTNPFLHIGRNYQCLNHLLSTTTVMCSGSFLIPEHLTATGK